MPPAKTKAPPQAAGIYDAYLACLAARGAGNKTFEAGARCFLAQFPDPQDWAGLPLAARLAGRRPQLQPLLNFLMHGHLRPGYDCLLEREFTVILREAAASPLGPGIKRFLAGAETLGYSPRPRTGMAYEARQASPIPPPPDADGHAGSGYCDASTVGGMGVRCYHGKNYRGIMES